MREEAGAYMLGPGEALPDSGDGVKASGRATGGALTVIESRTRGGAPPHVHHRDDECFYVLDGSVTVRCGAVTWSASPGSFVFLPRAIAHSWDVEGDFASVLIINVPGGFDEFLREFHAASGEERGSVSGKYGIEMLDAS